MRFTLALCVLLGVSAPASANVLQDQTAVPFTVVDQPLVNVLEEFGSSAGLPMTIDRRVGGRVTNFTATLTAREFLDQLAADHSIVWYFDGSSLHVTPAAANGSVVIDFGQVSAAQLNQTLDQMGVADPRFALRQTADNGIGVISGPPRYVEMVENAFLMLAKRRVQPATPGRIAKRITVVRGERVEVWSGSSRITATGTAPAQNKTEPEPQPVAELSEESSNKDK